MHMRGFPQRPISPMDPSDAHETNPLQGYFEWQVTTFMLAHDLSEPITPGPGAEDQANGRRRATELEVSNMVRNLLPKEMLDESAEWDREVMTMITRATLKRAAEIAGV